jgi:hypothetical protein
MKRLFKRLFQAVAKRKKLLIITTGIVAVLGVAGGAGVWWMARNAPDRLLYESMALDPFAGNPYTIQENIDSGGGDIRVEMYFEKDGTLRAEGALSCSVSSSTLGDVDMKASVLQVNEFSYIRIDELSFNGMEDEQIQSQLNSLFTEKVNGKWIVFEDASPAYLGYEEHGVMFDGMGAVSNKIEAKEIARKVKENKVVTILDRKEISIAGKDATEYSLLLRRSAYAQFIDSVEPRFGYKDEVLDTIFTSDTIEATVVIDNKTKRILSSVQSMNNQCTDFLSQFDPDAAASLPRKTMLRSKTSPTGTADKASKPADYITLTEYIELLSEE